ncbi:cytochrome P450 [Mycena sp. CBHHK59/15]|nr:cytochrome P450 [Mycena sp. CBHHK59/15]
MESYISTISFALAALTSLFLLHLKRSPLSAIPTVCPSGIFSSYLGALEYLHGAPKMIQRGYNQYKSGLFRVPYPDKWVVVLNSPALIDDLRRAHDDELSAEHGFAATLAVDYTLGAGFVTAPYHVRVIQSSLTRNMGARFDDLRDEISAAFGDEVRVYGDDHVHIEWTAVPALQTVLRVVSRTSNRLFVGAQLCRDPDYRDLNIEFTEAVMQRAKLINLFPNLLKPIIGPLLSPLPHAMKRARRHLYPLIEERLSMEAECGEPARDWDGRPLALLQNDLISWLLEHAPPAERTVHALAQRVLMVNFVAIHTTANSFTQALYHLAASPEYVQPLRAELAAAVRDAGWSKEALSRCVLLDSFLRESQRVNGVSAINMNRMVVAPAGITLADGTHLPRGSFVAAATYATHHDDDNYEQAETFDGFRFARMRTGGGEDAAHTPSDDAAHTPGDGAAQQPSSKYQMAAPDAKFLAFGLGKHACPGRFFAVTEMKLMLAHVLSTYDVKLEQHKYDGPGGDVYGRPPSAWFGTVCGANRTARVLFRKRAQAVGDLE